MTPYSYSPLQGDTIRLARLLPHPDANAPVQCELIDYPLPDNPGSKAGHFDALSYVWGSAEDRRSICVRDQASTAGQEDRQLAITANLHKALLQLRDHHLDRFLWVDAICINQEDTMERNHQVAMMARIYATASRVVVWLGDDNAADSAAAFDSLRDAFIRSAIYQHPENEEAWGQNDETASIVKLFEQQWFRRVWVLQEVAAARHVILMHGSSTIDGHIFALGAKMFQAGARFSDSVELALSAADIMKNALFRTPKPSNGHSDRFTLNVKSLGQLLDIFRTREASDPRDKIFALLGMCRDDLRESGLMPDYDIRWDTLSSRAMAFLLGKAVRCFSDNSGRLTVLLGKGSILGEVFEATRIDSENGGSYTIGYRTKVFSNKREQVISTEAPVSPVLVGDLVCLLEGSDKPIIVRICWDFLFIVKIKGDIYEFRHLASWDQQPKRQLFDFLLVWDWRTPEYPETWEYDSIGAGPLGDHSGITELECETGRVTRLRHVASMFWETGRYLEGEEVVDEALRLYNAEAGNEDAGDIAAARTIFEGAAHCQKILVFCWVKAYARSHAYDWDDETIELAGKMSKSSVLEQCMSKEDEEPIMVELWQINELGAEVWENKLMTELLAGRGNVRFGSSVCRWMLRPEGAKTTKLLLGSGLVHFGDMAEATARSSMEEDWDKLESLFHSRQGLHLTEKTLEAAAANKESGDRLMRRILMPTRQWTRPAVTAKTLEVAARNTRTGAAVFQLIKEMETSELPITDEVVESAARSGNTAVMDLLLGTRLTETPVPVTEAVTVAAVKGGSFELLQALFRSRGDELPITESLLITAVTWERVEMLELFVLQRGLELPVTEAVLAKVIIEMQSPKIRDFLFKHFEDKVLDFERRRYAEIKPRISYYPDPSAFKLGQDYGWTTGDLTIPSEYEYSYIPDATLPIHSSALYPESREGTIAEPSSHRRSSCLSCDGSSLAPSYN
ncbi:hypothetical protein OQA88_2203 [Cercophora sp. LCS_1]